MRKGITQPSPGLADRPANLESMGFGFEPAGGYGPSLDLLVWSLSMAASLPESRSSGLSIPSGIESETGSVNSFLYRPVLLFPGPHGKAGFNQSLELLPRRAAARLDGHALEYRAEIIGKALGLDMRRQVAVRLGALEAIEQRLL